MANMQFDLETQKDFLSTKTMEEISKTKIGMFDYIKISSTHTSENVK